MNILKRDATNFTIGVFWSFCCFFLYRNNFILLDSFLPFWSWGLTTSRTGSFSLPWPAFPRCLGAFCSVPFSFLSLWGLPVSLSHLPFWTLRWSSVSFWLWYLLCCSICVRFLCLYSSLHIALFLDFGFLFLLLFLLFCIKKYNI